MVLKLSVPSLVGRCNKCFPDNNVACLDETHFSTCFENSTTATITKCPDNRFCTNDVLICRTTADGYTPICYHNDHCGVCELTNGTFTCLDEKTYGFCYGGKTPLESSFRSCPQGYVCNYYAREVCVPEATNLPSCRKITTNTTEITTPPTESTNNNRTTTDSAVGDETILTTEKFSETTAEMTKTTLTEIAATTTQETQISTKTTTEMRTSSTTKTKRRDANKICGESKRKGFVASDDATCKEYVYCFVLSDQYLGWFYYCDGYFNAATQNCQKERPLNCVAH